VNANPLLKLESFGQSIWIDFISRGLITSGELQRLIEEDGVGGVTSNPSIFEKAIEGGEEYDSTIAWLGGEGKNAGQIFEAIEVEDIQAAADLLLPVYERLDGRDGFVSIEVSPRLANDTAKTIAEARRLWSEVSRPNVMIKVPGTAEGLPAIRQLIGEGTNVNITLLFGLPRYREVLESYLGGLETLAGRGKSLKSVASVASFFLSRIDTLVDPMLEKIGTKFAQALQGETALASAKAAYGIYQEIFQGERFRKLAAQGARPQRLLWASTGTKNPAYDDLKYVESLIGPDTVNTVPKETLNAYRDHGKPAARLATHATEAAETLKRLEGVGIDLDAVTQQLEKEGVQKFTKSLEGLLKALKQKVDDGRQAGAPA
jgi:transaldolase